MPYNLKHLLHELCQHLEGPGGLEKAVAGVVEGGKATTARQGAVMHGTDTWPLRLFTEWLQRCPEAQEWLAARGVTWPVVGLGVPMEAEGQIVLDSYGPGRPVEPPDPAPPAPTAGPVPPGTPTPLPGRALQPAGDEAVEFEAVVDPGQGYVTVRLIQVIGDRLRVLVPPPPGPESMVVLGGRREVIPVQRVHPKQRAAVEALMARANRGAAAFRSNPLAEGGPAAPEAPGGQSPRPGGAGTEDVRDNLGGGPGGEDTAGPGITDQAGGA